MERLRGRPKRFRGLSTCIGVVSSASLLLVAAGSLFYAKEVSGYHFGLLGLAAAGILLIKQH